MTSDLPGSNQLHPTAKYLVGIRSSIGARGAAYGEPIEYSGPVPASTSYVSGSAVVVDFTNTGGGLTTGDGTSPSPFEVAPSTNRHVSATAALVENSHSVQVQAKRVSAPQHVRYGFGGAGSLSNVVSIPTEGGTKTVTSFPASLFQLDFP